MVRASTPPPRTHMLWSAFVAVRHRVIREHLDEVAVGVWVVAARHQGRGCGSVTRHYNYILSEEM